MIRKKYKTYPVSGISRHCLFIIQMTRSAEIFSFFKFILLSIHITTYMDFNFFVRNISKIVIIMILHDISWLVLSDFCSLRYTKCGEGKRWNEFAKWHVEWVCEMACGMWLAEWHNYAECKIWKLAQRNKLNGKACARHCRAFLAPIWVSNCFTGLRI